jgi:hypothetical protein
MSDLLKAVENIALLAQSGQAIAAAAFTEGALERVIKTKIRKPLSGKLEKKLFEGYGPLGEFGPKIDLAYALELISEDVRTKCHAIKEIRNKFAHMEFVLDFTSEPILELFSSIPGYKKGIDAKALYYETIQSILDEFMKALDRDDLISALRGYIDERKGGASR